MLKEDKDKLRELLKNYSPKEVMADLSEVAMEAADDMSDNGMKDQAKDLVKFSVALDDLILGRPFLI